MNSRKPEPNATRHRLAALHVRLAGTLLLDARRLSRRIEEARRRGVGEQEIVALEAAVVQAERRMEARQAAMPQFSFPPELPVSQHADAIAAAIAGNPVVIVSGETGSGKTTQLPKICLAAGRGVRGMIGHTQPRRIAARAVATRIAKELGTPLGGAVGFKVRFSEAVHRDGYIKLMTDGILLAETQAHRDLLDYDTIIVDEAHERSLNIDFLLGYLKTLLARRDDLHLVITSATLDAERFSRHFAHDGKPAPVIEVSGRGYPVEVRYRPPGGRKASVQEARRGDDEDGAATIDDEEDLEDAIVAAAEDLWREGPGDILVFLPGEREIRETGELLHRSMARRPYAPAVEILPLYSRLSIQDQDRVFAGSNGRRIVLATNVAETSLTVPGIRYVIDTGLARVKRYAVRNKTTLLRIEPISRAAASQRAGRCGRVQAGICVRLYEESDLAKRPAFTDPEILRSSLASVILRMAALELGTPDAFPFVDPPTPRAIADGYQLLQELGAIDEARSLTPTGRELARLPLDPRIGRIVLAAKERGCLAEALVIASALSVPDPRERPLERAQAADQAHLRFRDERSDFLSLVALWEFFADLRAQGLSHRRMVDACRAQFVNWLRMTEWRDVHRQLESELEEAGWKWERVLPKEIDATRYALLHKALITGLLSNVGMRGEDGDGFLGTRGLRFHLHPASGLAKKPPRWVLAAELVETSRLYARCAARIEPEWVEEVAGPRLTRDHFEPEWDEKRGEVVASERVQLYGLTLVARRKVSFGSIDPATSREVFIREALVEGRLGVQAPFVAFNAKAVEEVTELEHKARRQDVLVDPDRIAAFYAERLTGGIHSRAGFEQWRKAAEAADPRLLFLTRERLMRHAAADVTEVQYPEWMEIAGARLPLEYRFAPGHPLDGLTLTVPLSRLNQLDEARLSWLVPGMIREKVGVLLKALPKAWRGRLVPLPPQVTAFLEATRAGVLPLHEALRHWLRERFGEGPPGADFADVALPPHLIVNLRVVDDAGKELASGRDVLALRERLGDAAQLSFAAASPSIERTGERSWRFGDIPEQLTAVRKAQRYVGYPALFDEGTTVGLKLFDTEEAARAAMRAGVIRLVRIALADAMLRHEKGGPGFAAAALVLKPALATERLLADTLDAIAERAFLADDPLPRSEAAFTAQVKRARTRLPAVAEGAFRLLSGIATEYQAVTQRLNTLGGAHARFAADVRAQRDALVRPGFVADTSWDQLVHLPRYLKALDRRIAKYLEAPERDARHAQNVAAWERRYRERADRDRQAGIRNLRLDAFRWLVEELKVSLFAQELKTPFPVSYKRLDKAWAELDR